MRTEILSVFLNDERHWTTKRISMTCLSKKKIKIKFLYLIHRNISRWNCPKSHVSGRIFYNLSSSSFELLKVPWFIEWIWPILKMSIAFEAIWICTKVDQGFCLPGFSQNMYVCIPKSVNYSKLHKEDLRTLSPLFLV